MMKPIDTSIIFAAGFGTRMHPITKDIPKPLVRIGDKTLLDHTLELAKNGNVKYFYLNTHHLADQIERHVAKKNDIKLNFETPKILDTGGGLKAISYQLNTPVIFTSNVDAIWQGSNPFNMLRENWCDKKMDCLLLLIPLKNSIGHSKLGDFEKTQNGLIKRSKKSGLIYSGVQIIKHSITQKNKKTIFSLNETWDELIEKERLYGIVYDGNWADVGSKENLYKAEKLLE